MYFKPTRLGNQPREIVICAIETYEIHRICDKDSGVTTRPWNTKERKRRLKYAIKRATKVQVISARSLASIAGQCVSMNRVVIPRKQVLRSVYRVLRTSWQDMLPLSMRAIKDLNWWLKALTGGNGWPIESKTIEAQKTTVVSSSGWVAHMGNRLLG